MQAGKFSEAQEHLDWLLSAIPLVVVSTRAEANEVKELLGICTEYKVAVYIEMARKNLPAEDEKRQVRWRAVPCLCFVTPSPHFAFVPLSRMPVCSWSLPRT